MWQNKRLLPRVWMYISDKQGGSALLAPEKPHCSRKSVTSIAFAQETIQPGDFIALLIEERIKRKLLT